MEHTLNEALFIVLPNLAYFRRKKFVLHTCTSGNYSAGRSVIDVYCTNVHTCRNPPTKDKLHWHRVCACTVQIFRRSRIYQLGNDSTSVVGLTGRCSRIILFREPLLLSWLTSANPPRRFRRRRSCCDTLILIHLIADPRFVFVHRELDDVPVPPHPECEWTSISHNAPWLAFTVQEMSMPTRAAMSFCHHPFHGWRRQQGCPVLPVVAVSKLPHKLLQTNCIFLKQNSTSAHHIARWVRLTGYWYVWTILFKWGTPKTTNANNVVITTTRKTYMVL